MKNRFIKIALAGAMLALLFTGLCGCSSEPYIGYWKVEASAEVGKESNRYQEPMAITVEVRRNGTIMLGNVLFGNYTRDRNRYSFSTVVSDEFPEAIVLAGEWEIQPNGEMWVYRDTYNIVYILTPAKNTNDPLGIASYEVE